MHLLILTVILLVMSTLANGQQPSCFNVTGNHEPYSYSNMGHCSYYQGKTCCPKEFSDALASGASEIEKVIDKFPLPRSLFFPLNWCLDQVNMLLCMPCSPSTANFITMHSTNQAAAAAAAAGDKSRVVEVTVCNSLCDRIYSKCSLFPAGPEGTIGSVYKDGADMCDNFLFKNMNSGVEAGATRFKTGTERCFSAAGPSAVAGNTIVVALLSFMIAMIAAVW